MKEQMADPGAVKFVEQNMGIAPWTTTDYIGVTVTIVVVMSPFALVAWWVYWRLIRWLEGNEKNN